MNNFAIGATAQDVAGRNRTVSLGVPAVGALSGWACPPLKLPENIFVSSTGTGSPRIFSFPLTLSRIFNVVGV